MATALYFHPAAAQHVTPRDHPEQVARYQTVIAALEGLELIRRSSPQADPTDLLRCHPQAYLDRIRAAEPATGYTMLDEDTHMSPGSFEAAMRAAGGACAAVDAVIAGQVDNVFVAMRPPGHHAEREKPMGFCLFGNAAIAARRALDHHGLTRVAVLDFDVHHGNGTQDLLWDEPRAFFASSHQMPLYPGTGAASERGAHGQMVNAPLEPGSDGDAAQAIWRDILRQCESFRPELVILSAGFDAHRDDPLAQLNWDDGDFSALTRMICDMAMRCSAPVVSCLEGGYDLAALGRSVRAHVTALLEAGK
jgi:acetoin utilization deacetylase AcuC-like enzyme